MSSLETSITLDDVFAVVEAKRVPLAPELAGYLALEIADGTDAGSGEVDPKTVFISEEGTVALVRPKRESVTGDAEASVRSLLTKLLEASGSGTPALSTAAKRKPGNGLPALVEELEAALIPVNRSAGRRALARLVREVKRVVHGVGRNASAAPIANKAVSNAPHARPVLRKRESDPKFTPPKLPEPTPAEIIEPPPAPVVAEPPARAQTPRQPEAIPSPIIREATPAPAGMDEVDALLGSFAVSSAHGDKQMARELKAIAGLSPTPPPPDAKTLAELTRDVGKDLPKRLDSSKDISSRDVDGVEALLALADASVPIAEPIPAKQAAHPPVAAPLAPPAPPPSPVFAPPPRAEAAAPRPRPEPVPPPAVAKPKRRDATGPAQPRAPKTSMAILVLALLVLGGAVVAVWQFAPQVFTGRKPVASARPSASAVVPPAPKCKVALVLTEVPDGAEILLRVGQAPVDVERMPVGTRLEFVGTAEGHAPRRTVIKADMPWDKGPDGKPRIEVPIQLDPSKAKPGTVDPWPPGEPGNVGGSGAPGTVHVVSNVRGAEVWLLAGLGPEARIDQLRCDADIDVLLAGPPNLRRRLHVGEADITKATPDAAGNKVVSVSAKEPSAR